MSFYFTFAYRSLTWIEDEKKDFATIREINRIHIIRDTYCGVMKPLADMPSCLGGGDHRTNKV